MRLKDQVAIVTGVSHTGQVGYALAAAFAREGAFLAISARSAERVNARAQELHAEGARVLAIPADLTTAEGANTLIRETLAAYGCINILVNLAGGLTKYGPGFHSKKEKVRTWTATRDDGRLRKSRPLPTRRREPTMQPGISPEQRQAARRAVQPH